MKLKCFNDAESIEFFVPFHLIVFPLLRRKISREKFVVIIEFVLKRRRAYLLISYIVEKCDRLNAQFRILYRRKAISGCNAHFTFFFFLIELPLIDNS